MAKHQRDAAVADRHTEKIRFGDAPLVKQQAQEQYQGGVEVKNQALQRGADVSQAGKVEKTGEVIAGKTQPDHPQPVLSGEPRLAPAGPPRHDGKYRQREKHAVHDQRDRIHAIAVGELDDDRLTAECDRADAGKQQANRYAFRSFRRLLYLRYRHFWLINIVQCGGCPRRPRRRESRGVKESQV